jgi:hypothetical protein
MATKKVQMKSVKKVTIDLKKAVRKAVDSDMIADAVQEGMEEAPKGSEKKPPCEDRKRRY